MKKSVKTTVRRKTENIPILRTAGYTYGTGVAVYEYENAIEGIFAPFEGVFLLVVKQTIPALVGDTVNSRKIQLPNIYGKEQTLYRGDTPVTVGNLTVGCYLCHFDTDTRKLYIVES